MPRAALSCDVDTLASIYKGTGCRRPGGYTYAELRMGLENFHRFLEPYGIQATLFMVGQDLEQATCIPWTKAMASGGHEIANHTYSHAQGFRLLSSEQKEAEIAGMELACERAIGRRPVGFRSPGWNIGDDALPILRRRGYLYDSSVHPTFAMPLLKLLHWRSTARCSPVERTTMGHLYYALAPTRPYRTSASHLGKRGSNGLLEFPVTVVPGLRLPFWATVLLSTGIAVFTVCYQLLRSLQMPIQFQFHLSDFVDYSHFDLADQVPHRRDGVYVPQALRTPLAQKWNLFKRAVDVIAEDYHFSTLEEWAQEIKSR